MDTYDTLRSGVPNAIKVAKEFGDKIHFKGIRLDSGDLAYLSKKARAMLDEAGFYDAKIIASNDLDEYTIMNLQAEGAKIDIWGIGTKLITAFDQAALGAVYKLVSIENESGEMRDTIKLSGNPEKISTPGQKRVYRIINKENGHAEGDYITLATEAITQEPLKMFHPVHPYLNKVVTNYQAIELHHPVIKNGQIQITPPLLTDIQKKVEENLELLWNEYKRTLNPEEYPVDLSKACWENKRNYIEKMKRKTNRI